MNPRTVFLAGLVWLGAGSFWVGAASPAAPETPLPGAMPYEIEVVPAPPARSWRLMAMESEGVLYVPANELAAALGLDKFWRADLGRLILAGPTHRISVIEGTELAVIDDGRLLHLPGPVFLRQGQMMLPLDLFVDASGEPMPWVEQPLVFSKANRTLRIGEEGTRLEGGDVAASDSGWTFQLEASGRLRPEVRQEAGPELVLRMAGLHYDPARAALPAGDSRWLPWVVGFRCEATAGGFEVHLIPGPSAHGYRVATSDSNQVLISLGPFTDSLTPFSGNAFSDLRRIVLDPGHGGDDAGAAVKGGKEAKLALALAGYVRDRLQEAGMQVQLTRDERQDPSPDARAETANQDGADLFLSVHVHARGGGPIAYVSEPTAISTARASSLDDLGFRRFGTDHVSYASESRSIAGALLRSVMGEGAAKTPSRGIETESLPELAGARMPALLLELGTDSKGWSDNRLRDVAERIAAGIADAAGRR
jgi:N-acetylmuramoyl-L-alanine amidase